LWRSEKKGGLNRVKIPLLIVGFFLSLSGTSQAGPPAHGFRGGGFHGFRGGGFHGRFIARNAGSAFRMRPGIHHNFANRRFFAHNRPIFFQQFAWPVYWYPYDDPLAYSYLEPDSDYQYWDNSATSVQPESFGRATDRNPVVVVINTGNSRAMDSSPNTGYVDNGYLSNSRAGQQRMIVQAEKTESRTDSMKPVTPAVPQATPTAQNAFLQTQPGVFGKLVLVSWSEERGKDVIFVENIETNDVQQITSQPNIDNFRLVEIHPNADLRQFEAIISNGSEQGAVRFRF
jgi:hypothetical protein